MTMNSQTRTVTFLEAALEWPVVTQALKVALVVGTILVGINQGDVILAGGAVNWWKVALTYCVPYSVSTYSAAMVTLSLNRARETREQGGG